MDLGWRARALKIMFSTLYQDSSPDLSVHCQVDHTTQGEVWKIFSLHAQLYLNWQTQEYQWYEGVESVSQDPGQPDSKLCHRGLIGDLTSTALQQLFKNFWHHTVITEILRIIAKHQPTQ